MSLRRVNLLIQILIDNLVKGQVKDELQLLLKYNIINHKRNSDEAGEHSEYYSFIMDSQEISVEFEYSISNGDEILIFLTNGTIVDRYCRSELLPQGA